MAGINEYPLEYRRMIYKRIEAATGESAEKIEKAYFKKLEKILERGVIKDREEYELVHSRIDELVHNTPEDDPARKDLPELERIFMNYAIGEKPNRIARNTTGDFLHRYDYILVFIFVSI